MSLDIRTPIGYFFTLIGIVLMVFGALSGPEMYEQHSLGINVNLWWGLVLLAFGAYMLAMALAAGKKRKNPPANSE
jgi:membrane-bound ClpP family serine protease